MSGPDTNWRDRCEMFFSSINKYTEEEVKKAKKRKREEKKSKVPVIDGNPVNFPGFYEGNVTTFSKKKQPFKGFFRWLSSVDLHGTRMLQRSRSHLFCVCWITIIIIGCGLCGAGFYKSIDEYLDEDVEMKTTMITDGSNASPLSLVVCNKNIIRKSKITPDSRFHGLDILNVTHLQNLGVIQNSRIASVETILANTELRTFLQEENLMEKSLDVLANLNEEYVPFGEMLNESDWENVGRALLSVDYDPFPRAFRITSSEIQDLGHEIDLNILECTKNGRQCDSSEISYVENAEFGQCAVIYLSLEGSWFDKVTLTLDVQPEDYLGLASPRPGIRAIVQSASSLSTSWLPTHSHDFAEASPGKGLHLAVSKTHEIKRKSKNCRRDPNYNKLNCVSRCLVLQTARVCGCSISLPSLLSQRCRVDIHYEFLCQRLLRELYARNQLPCNCPHPCKEELLDVTTSSYEWIKNDSEDLLTTSLELAGKTYNFSNIRDSVTKIQVSWSHSPFVRLEEEDGLSLIGLLLKLSAVSAITVGISVITLVEFIWLLGKAFVYLCCAVNNRNDHSDDVHQLYPVQHIYPEFDNINVDGNWYADDGRGRSHGQSQGRMVHEPLATLRLANSPLNRRRIITPTPQQAPYTSNHNSAVPAQGEFIYRGRPRDSGFVYGETPENNKVSSRISNGRDSLDIHRQNKKRTENELFSKPWDKSGRNGVYPKVFVPNPNASENKEVPLFNSPYITVGEEYVNPNANTISNNYELETEGNTLNHITNAIHNPDNSKTTGSGEQSKTESQRHADNDLKDSDDKDYTNDDDTSSRDDGDDDGHGGGDEDGNIFKISGADMNEISWIPDNTANAQGPDLSRFNAFLQTSTHKPPKAHTPTQEIQENINRHQQSHSRDPRTQRGFGRSAKKHEVDKALRDTSPSRGNTTDAIHRTRLLSPNTWHNYNIVSSSGNPPPAMAQPVSYVVHGYDGRDVVYRYH